MAIAYLGLGGNLGDRLGMLRAALKGLADVGRLVAVSPVYETAPWGDLDQPPYLNICCALETILDPFVLLAHAKDLECGIGRRATRHWGPREIDIDILCYEQMHIATPILTVPHPHIAERAFVLAPLADIAPDLLIPGLERTVSALLAALPDVDASVHRVGESAHIVPMTGE